MIFGLQSVTLGTRLRHALGFFVETFGWEFSMYFMLGLHDSRFLLTKIWEYYLKYKLFPRSLKTLCNPLLQPRQLSIYS